MNWIFYALICVAGWGLADLFYKMGSKGDDDNSHLKQAICVGMVMGAVSLGIMLFGNTGIKSDNLLRLAVQYSPASISYIISMVIGYAGLRYLELSIVSPVQNASGALSCICMIVYYILSGRGNDILGSISCINIIGTIAVTAGVLLLAFVERESEEDKPLKGLGALIFPILYCVFDTIGTAADGIILDESSGLCLGEQEVLVLYGLTFFAAGIVCFIILWVKYKRPYNMFAADERSKLLGAVAEEFGQIFYIYAMSANAVASAPAVASYCVFSALLSSVFLKEKLNKKQYISVALVIFGIILMGIAEGLEEI